MSRSVSLFLLCGALVASVATSEPTSDEPIDSRRGGRDGRLVRTKKEAGSPPPPVAGSRRIPGSFSACRLV